MPSVRGWALAHRNFGLALMRSVRSIVCWLVALEAVICFWAGSVSASRAAQLAHDWRTHAALWELAVALPVTGVGALFAAFCVAYWRRRRSAWTWAMVTGGFHLFAAASLGTLEWVTARFQGQRVWPMTRSVGQPAAGLAALGVLTIAAFWQWNAKNEGKTAPAHPRIAGDWTHPVGDVLVWVLALAGFVAAMVGWFRWGTHAGLPRDGALPYLVEVVIAELAMVLVHEAGHALTGKLQGMRVRAFVVGPFQWRIREGRWRFQLRLADFLATGGSTAVVPTDPHQPRNHEIRMIAGGPAASLGGGLVALAFLLTAPGHAWQDEWRLLALFVTFSLLAAVVNLVPFRTRTSYSDGAQLGQLLSGGPWGDYHHALGIVGSSLVTPLRPRDFDIAAMQRAAEIIREGVRGTHLRLLEYCYYLDHGQLREATLAVNEAEEKAQEVLGALPVELYSDFVFAKAFVQRDADGTRTWWARLAEKIPSEADANADQWLARAAALWMDGKMAEAKQAWERGYAVAERLPDAGAYDFDRDKYAMLRRELDAERRVLRWHDDVALSTH